MSPLPCCRVCHRTMRPHHTSIGDFPGTLQQGGRGLCSSCRKRERRDKDRASSPDMAAWVEAQRGHLAAYFRSRGRTTELV